MKIRHHMHGSVLIFLLLCCHISAATLPLDKSTPVLTSAREVAHYPTASLELQPAVELTAVVTHVDSMGIIFVGDESGATFIRNLGARNPYQPGQQLAIKGVRNPGLFIGGIDPVSITVVGDAPLPMPKAVRLADLVSGRYHYERVVIEGVGRRIERTGESSVTLHLAVAGGEIPVRLDQNSASFDRFVDAAVSVTGISAGAISDRRQLVDPCIRVADAGSVVLLKPAPLDPFGMTRQTLEGLTAVARESSPAHRIRIDGRALAPVLQGQAFIRCESGALRVRLGDSVDVAEGDAVSALGFPEMGIFSAILADAEIRRMDGPVVPMEPVSISQKDFNRSSLDADLVTLEATLIRSLSAGRELIATIANQELLVRLPSGEFPEYSSGSKLQFTGIWRVNSSRVDGYHSIPSGFELWLRSPADVRLISTPPWWNARRLWFLLGALFAVIVLIAIWAALLRRQVSRQVRVIKETSQREAVIEERQRIAREFHDTLDQELAGISLRLDAALSRFPEEKAHSLLSQIRRLLFRLQTETREFVWDLRDESQHQPSLETAMQALVDHLQCTSSIVLQFRVAGAIPTLPPLIRHQLLRVAREAIHNSVKYSRATAIRVSLRQQGGGTQLTISDDGQGFDPAIARKHDNQFGLQGIRERVRKIGGVLEIKSQPGQGARIEVTL